ncbi:hypothetical protein GGR52DRAFT_46170 [Hypoxylon sp. FL1284]|nr:hypothetical protein GGR52DRAFT_46170 [Hypoxylon sp. FL1284]
MTMRKMNISDWVGSSRGESRCLREETAKVKRWYVPRRRNKREGKDLERCIGGLVRPIPGYGMAYTRQEVLAYTTHKHGVYAGSHSIENSAMAMLPAGSVLGYRRGWDCSWAPGMDESIWPHGPRCVYSVCNQSCKIRISCFHQVSGDIESKAYKTSRSRRDVKSCSALFGDSGIRSTLQGTCWSLSWCGKSKSDSHDRGMIWRVWH